MTRRFLDTIRSNITTELPDNTTGEISPADERGILTDIVDSTVSDDGYMYGDNPVVFPSTPVWQDLPASVFHTVKDASPYVLPSLITGAVTTWSEPGYNYTIRGTVGLQADNNEEVDIGISVNGADPILTYPVTAQGGQTDREVSVSISAFFDDAPANTTINIMIKTPGGNEDVDIERAVLLVVINPTNNDGVV